MPISPFDIAIILISSVACIYCIVLSRRLKALQNTRNGLGATIKALSDSISAVSATTDETRFHAGELGARLARSIEDAKVACEHVENQIQRLHDAHAKAQAMPVTAPPPVPRADPIQSALDATNQRMSEISGLMDRLKDLTEDSVATAEKEPPALRPLPTQLRSRMKVV